MKALLRHMPSMDLILSSDRIIEHIEAFGREHVKEVARLKIEQIKKEILDGRLTSLSDEYVVSEIVLALSTANQKSLRPLINATGVLLHTNMGRALLSEEMAESVKDLITHYNTLEFDLDSGKRGHRDKHIEDIIKKVTGAEGAIVVNNNAAAVMLMLDTFSKGKEAIVSRGELVEIGGSFRVPSVMEASGALLKEVGTTNKTHLKDYEEAITEMTGVLLKVHTSNYKILGFTSSVDAEDLVELGKIHQIPVIEDLGAGSLVPLDVYDLEREPTVQEQVAKGIDLVSFSGDKLLGGPQCGIIVGKKVYIDILRKNQLLRALRVGKMTLSVLQEVLSKYLYGKANEIPFYKMLTRSSEWFDEVSSKIMVGYDNKSLILEVIDTECQIGGGSLPIERVPSKAISIKSNQLSANYILDALRMNDNPIICRIENNQCILELRTLLESDIEKVIEGINNVK